ncbi:plastocyanin [Nocardia sp. NBC_01388]|uniref:plastocyanin n=1 Tax=Nocardia sp. NBC_01388 TaxID=2903596 RepID=UPI0032548831
MIISSNRLVAAVCLSAVTVFVAGACSSSSGGGQPSTSASGSGGAPDAITISGYKFQVPSTVAPGARVTVRNDDGVEHSVTSKTQGLFDIDVEAKSAVTFTAPENPGSYALYCRYHPSMVATLTVG